MKKLNITKVKQTEREILVELPVEISSQIKGDKLFLEAYNINPKFQLKYENKKILISLMILGLDQHFVYYIVPLLDKILQDILMN